MAPGSRRPEVLLARRGGGVELLRLPAALYGAATGIRGALYDRGWLPVERLDVPVVCVGNLTAGGTGKTPMVAHVVRALQARGHRPGLLSRGYGGRADDRRKGGANDEGALLAALLPGVPHVFEADRASGGRRLVERGVDAIVMDDGFQHRRLVRDLDLVLVDATRPWGLPAPEDGGAPVRALLPRGLLRESPRALTRAGALVLTRTDQVEAAALDALDAELERLAPGLPRLRAVHRPRRLVSVSGGERALDALRDAEVDLVSGIGNPEAFERTVEELGARVTEHRRFPDHHAFGAGDVAGLGAGGRALVTTAKDAVKLARLAPDALALEVELELVAGAPVLDALLDALPAGRARRERASLHEGLHG